MGNLVINGVASSNGGTFGDVIVNGKGTVNGEIQCKNLESNGIAALKETLFHKIPLSMERQPFTAVFPVKACRFREQPSYWMMS